MGWEVSLGTVLGVENVGGIANHRQARIPLAPIHADSRAPKGPRGWSREAARPDGDLTLRARLDVGGDIFGWPSAD